MQCHHGATIATDHDDSNEGMVGSSSVWRVTSAVHSDKRQVRPPMDHSKKLLMEAYPNYAYPTRNKLKDCDLMKSFTNLGSPTQGTELNEGLGGSDMLPFPREDAVMMVYGGLPSLRRHHVSNLSPGAPTPCSWGHGAQGCNGTCLPISL
jgi:hypothetical protein